MAGRTISIAALETMPVAHLQKAWDRHFGMAAPSLSPDLLRRGLSYRLQEKKLGRLDRRTAACLARYGSEDIPALPKLVTGPKLSTGTKLIRDWHGVGHSVTVLDDGFEYDGKRWKSLTAIARHITGTKWSGPRFFGLTIRAAAL
ncbi:DUF2924 domain-containing protein [Parasphingorhabdus sp.]|jgi:hypothetical protein|uniref:DUF2924 domain-containing protein n=1 Tax=Parasphingorhabdus sp. TaxID=2709688 RepID=UPI0032EFE018